MNEVSCFMYYMYNKWDRLEAIRIFGNDLGTHIYDKWMQYRSNGNGDLFWYSELDNVCRQKVVDRANEIYGTK